MDRGSGRGAGTRGGAGHLGRGRKWMGRGVGPEEEGGPGRGGRRDWRWSKGRGARLSPASAPPWLRAPLWFGPGAAPMGLAHALGW